MYTIILKMKDGSGYKLQNTDVDLSIVSFDEALYDKDTLTVELYRDGTVLQTITNFLIT